MDLWHHLVDKSSHGVQMVCVVRGKEGGRGEREEEERGERKEKGLERRERENERRHVDGGEEGVMKRSLPTGKRKFPRGNFSESDWLE